MGILNPIVSKFQLASGVATQVYSCPIGKSHSIIDVNFYKDDVNSDALISIALTTESNPVNLTSVDYFIDDIELIGTVNIAELNKLIVGEGERLYIKIVSGPDIVTRISGVEEANVKVANAGRLAALAINSTAQTKVYENLDQDVSYISASLTLFNVSTVDSATMEVWITSSASPSASDKVIKVTIPAQDTTIIESIMLAPNEKIFVQSTELNSEVFLNGILVKSS